MEFDELGGLGILTRQVFQGLIKGQQVIGRCPRQRIHQVEVQPAQTAAVFL
jgi:hypothetical protein